MRLGLLNQVLTRVTKSFVIASLGAIAAIATINQKSYANDNKFFCGQSNGAPVTMVRTSRGNEPFIRWVVKDFSNSGFTPQKRCEMVSARFQRYYDNGTLYITSRNDSQGYPVLCIADRKGGSCLPDNVLVTLKPGTDTGRVLRQILDFRRGADVKPVELSGSHYESYSDGDLYVDVKQLVDQVDTEEGSESAATNTPNGDLYLDVNQVVDQGDSEGGSESATTNTRS
ncbi:COP23 domain-containing protein [Mastigocladopsis repens]|uniref:COP23 domain-containing protein n=1 Tax=Mastigocladopsis repens TaxID=221287 RepID=UPI0003098B7E|nr:COP23 domain-containing protein [Mastigocladopsis repens]